MLPFHRELMGAKVVDGLFIPASVGNALHYYIIYGVKEEELVPILEREKLLFFVRYILGKHFGNVLSFRFAPRIKRGCVELNISEVRVPGRTYHLKGVVKLKPQTASLLMEVEVEGVEEDSRLVGKRVLEEGVVEKSGNTYEARFYI